MLAPLLEVLEKMPADKRREALAVVYADKSNEEAKEELLRKLQIIHDWNEKDPPPLKQLVTSTPKPGKGLKTKIFTPSGKGDIATGPRPLIVKRAPDLEKLDGTFAAPSPMGVTTKPKFHTFSGDAKIKADVDYETWRHEVLSAASSNTEEAVREAMLLSLKGRAADVARFAAQYGVIDALAVLDSTFGDVAPAPVLVKEFHSECFTQGEEIADFGTRLMDKLQRIRRLFPGEISEAEMPKMLRDRFYHGLPDHYRSTLRYFYDSEPTYESLFRRAREVESELKSHKGTVAKAKAAKAQAKEGVAVARSAPLVTTEAKSEEGKRGRKRGRGRGGRGGAGSNQSVAGGGNSQNVQAGGVGTGSQPTQQSNREFVNRGRGVQRGVARGRGRGEGRDRSKLTCYKCGGLGHDARECPTPSYVVQAQSGNWRQGPATTDQAPAPVVPPSAATGQQTSQHPRNHPVNNQQ